VKDRLIGVVAAIVILVLGGVIFYSIAHSAEVPRAALPYQAQLTREARYAFGMDGPVAMLGAQIHQASSYDPNAGSAFASGLAQFTPGTAAWLSGLYKDLGPAAPLDPGWAIRALVTYDKRLHDGVTTFNSDCDRWKFSLSDYNGGSGWRISRQAHSVAPGDYTVTSIINPGISKANQRQNSTYPVRIVYMLQPIYAAWGTKRVC